MDRSTQDLTWHKSTLSGANNDDCVEVANLPSGGQAVRDSKDPNGPILNFTHAEWQSFTNDIKNGKFD